MLHTGTVNLREATPLSVPSQKAPLLSIEFLSLITTEAINYLFACCIYSLFSFNLARFHGI